MITHENPRPRPRAAVRSIDRRPGRTPDEERVILSVDGITPAAWGLLSRGRPADGSRRWADLVVADPVLADVVDWVGRGGAVMVAYNADDAERALRRRIPPAATPVGFALLEAGCRWFKDWYFADGGREGATKLQATVPVDAFDGQAAAAALVTELENFRAAGAGTETRPGQGRAGTAGAQTAPGRGKLIDAAHHPRSGPHQHQMTTRRSPFAGIARIRS